VVRERERQPQLASELRAETARTQQPDLGQLGRRRNGLEPRGIAGEHPHHVGELAREVLGGQAIGGAAQGEGGSLVGAGGASYAEIDPSGMQRGQRAELLGDHERGVVGQHHSAGAHPDRRGHGR